MIAVSIGILFLAVATLIVAQRQSEHYIEQSYRRGFADGAEVVIQRKYITLTELENEKD